MVVALASVGVVAAAGGAHAADVPPALQITEYDDRMRVGLVTDDAIYLSDASEGSEGDVYRLALTAEGGETRVGPPTFLTTAAPYSSMAEHAGSLAYVRPDGRLVLRTSDGTEVVPEWASEGDFPSGVGTLTARWVVPAWSTHVYDVGTGAELDLLAASGLTQAQLGSASVTSLALTDERALWVVAVDGAVYPQFRVLTAALDADGVVGTPMVLEQAQATEYNQVLFESPHVVGSSLVWVRNRFERVGSSVYRAQDLRWDAAAPYGGPPSSALLSDFGTGAVTLADDGTSLVGVRPVPDPNPSASPLVAIEWRDPTNPTTVVRSLAPSYRQLGGFAGTVAVLRQGEGWEQLYVVDAAGRAVTADGWYPPVTFSDVREGEPFYADITWLSDNGITTGYPDGTFRRTGPVNRDAMAAFLYRLVNGRDEPAACTEAPFTDVPTSHPFCPEITWLAASGITTGFPDGTYRPGSPVTREAMAAFLYRQAHDGATAPACTTAPFSDVSVSGPFCGAITWLAEEGVTTGWPDGTFRPGARIERQAMAAFLHRFADLGAPQ